MEMIFSRTLSAIIILLTAGGLSMDPENQSQNRIHHEDKDCSHKGHKLYGRVQVVNSFPDLKVQIVTSFPDLKVKIVDSQPTKCGEWKIVSEFPDMKVQFVNSFPDIKIQIVQSFPGLPAAK